MVLKFLCSQKMLIFRKALKCFEKAFSLDRCNKEAGGNLSDLYLELEMEVSTFVVFSYFSYSLFKPNKFS